MADRTIEQITTMTRLEVARINASELNAALFPEPERPDDAILPDEKTAIQLSVADVTGLHRRELSAWAKANGCSMALFTEEERQLLARPHPASARRSEERAD